MKAGAVRVRLLGTSAGGGLPQWNCGCVNCRDARAGSIPARGQCAVAIRTGEKWLLINAPPDLASLMAGDSAFHPPSKSSRASSIAGVLLTSADLDHALGLLCLREGESLPVYATAAIRESLDGALGLSAILESFCGVSWCELPLEERPLLSGGLHCRAIPLPGHAPRFAPKAAAECGHRVAYEFFNPATGGRLVVAPDVAEVTGELRRALERSDRVLLDGTFWSETELQEIKSSAAPASAMGHLPMRESLGILEALPARTKAYIHVNNTNPVLQPGSPERRLVEAAGVIIPDDGTEWLL